MKEYTSTEPEFSPSIQLVETTDTAHPDTINAAPKQLLCNTLFLKAKNALLETEIAKAIAIALGRNQALVFDTYETMAAWFSDAANAEQVAALSNGTNLYIVDTDVPDYWWSSVNQKYYQLETQKADLTKYDNIIGENDISGLSDDGTITGALVKQEEKVAEINSNITSLKKSVADGKASVASAITAKGVSTASDATFATMASNIGKIKTTFQTVSQTVSNSNYGGSGSTVTINLVFSNLSKVSGISYFALSYNEGNGSTRNVSFSISGNTVVVTFVCFSSSVNFKATVTAFEVK